MIDAVVFDWGGTLTPWHDIDLVSQWYAYAEAYDPARAAELARGLCESEIRLWDRQKDTAGVDGTGSLDRVFAEHGIDVTSAEHAKALARYLDFWDPHTWADPQAAPLLRDLRERGLLIGVLSNTMWPAAHHDRIFDRDGLRHLIDAAVYTSELPVGKPHAQSYAAIAEALAVDPTRIVFVGDRLWEDVHGPQQAGMRAIHIPHSRIPAGQLVELDVTPDAVADSLADVGVIIARWLGDA